MEGRNIGLLRFAADYNYPFVQYRRYLLYRYNAAYPYDDVEDVEKDDNEAEKFLNLAAQNVGPWDKFYPEVQNSLGSFYYYLCSHFHNAVVVNNKSNSQENSVNLYLELARKYLNVSAKQGDETAIKRLVTLNEWYFD